MGIRFYCPNGHKLNVKKFQAGLKGICPYCGAKIQIPTESTRSPSKKSRASPSVEAERAEAASVNASEAARPAGETHHQPGSPATTEGSAGGDVSLGEPGAEERAGQGGLNAAAPAATDHAAPADPLAEGGEVVWYVRPRSGGQYGPAVSEVMRKWIAEGRVGPDSLVWREGWRDWREASQVFPSLGAGRAASYPAEVRVAATGNYYAATTRSVWSGRRRHAGKQQAAMIVILILAVLILFGVLIWVLTTQWSGGTSPTGHRPSARSPYTGVIERQTPVTSVAVRCWQAALGKAACPNAACSHPAHPTTHSGGCVVWVA